ncbi:MAG: 4-(cytidine 5'-diphospho)-2-C-methyl-D-erythritol kinase [Chitinivibrionales bacterium]|nr:4-(cytidine 5'-diphospho)-2-C-methyl-D-erythritol kinase [Chitinivibrionales bacterium]
MLEQKSYTRLTLCLDIIRKIPSGAFQGYHELAIIKHQIDLSDSIRITPADTLSMSCNNPAVPLDRTNTCWKAVQLLMQRFSIDQSLHIHIEKAIPVQGGLAGGSANAATVISMCNNLWNLGLSKEQLSDIGRTIGMDVPYFFMGKTAFDSEATGILEPIPTKSAFDFVLAVPSFGVSTRRAYETIDYARIGTRRQSTEKMRQQLVDGDQHSALSQVHNDFEFSVFNLHPELAVIKEELIRLGCTAACLSGSGSTILGVAKDREHSCWIARKYSGKALCSSTLSDQVGEGLS